MASWRTIGRFPLLRLVWTARCALELMFLCTTALLVVGPVMMLVVGAWIGESGSADSAGSWSILLRPSTLTILRHNLFLTLATTVVALLFACAIVFLLRSSGPKVLVWAVPLLLALLLTDPLTRNFGWYFLLRTDGPANHLLVALGLVDHPAQLLYRFETISLVMSHGLFPLAAIPVLLAVMQIPPGVYVTAKILGASRWTTFRHLTAPLLSPGVILGLCFVLTSAFGYYITPRMLGGDAGLTIAGLIEQRVNLLLDWQGASALAMILTIVSLLFLALFLRTFNRLSPARGFEAVPLSIDSGTSRWRGPIAIVLLFLAVTLPLLPILLTSFNQNNFLAVPPEGFSLRWFKKVITDPYWSSAWAVSLVVATLSALLATLAGAGAVSLATRTPRLSSLPLLVSAVPLLVPPIALAIGLYRVLAGLGVSAEWFRLVVGHTVRVLPYPTLTLFLAWRGLNPLLFSATRVYAGTSPSAWFRALGPHFGPSLCAGFLLAWVTSFNDLEISLFLSGPHSTTLPVQLWSGLHFGIEPSVAACGTLTTTVGVVILFLVIRLLSAMRGAVGL